MKHYNDIMNKGGTWLGNLRSRIQTMFINGDTVTWGSNDELRPNVTVKDVEELGSYAVAGYHNEVVEPLLALLEESKQALNSQLSHCDKEVTEKLIAKIHYVLTGVPYWLSQMNPDFIMPRH